MIEAYRSFWRNYFNFTGRSTREDFWWVMLGHTIIYCLLGGAFLMFAPGAIQGITWFFVGLLGLFSLVILIPNLALMIRRMRDAGIYWLWILIGLTGIGWLVLFIFSLLPTKN